MRYDLDGDGNVSAEDLPEYRKGFPGANSSGIVCATACQGYELNRSLDFDADGDGSSWAEVNGDFVLDAGDNNNDYFPVSEGGWLPIGSDSDPFVAVFEGNGHSIRNLAISRPLSLVGMFAEINIGGQIRNLALLNALADYSGSSGTGIGVGNIAGSSHGSTTPFEGGSIVGSYASATVSGGDGGSDYVGGLVGQLTIGEIIASNSSGTVDGGGGGRDKAGGLVGEFLGGGLILASHSIADVDGGGKSSIEGGDSAGGLVGEIAGQGRILASYAAGVVNAGDGGFNEGGGLVGLILSGTPNIVASYARGEVFGGNGTRDFTAGLVGRQLAGSIRASYATGNVDAGNGSGDVAGALLALQTSGTVTESYGFGILSGNETTSTIGIPPAEIVSASQINASNVNWNNAAGAIGAWDFGDASQPPALVYADYDGPGGTDYCALFPATIPGSTTPIVCGSTLLPGQGR